MYHPYNLREPDFDKRYTYWWETLKRWFPNYDNLPYEKRMVAIETINGLLGAL